jgi:hypothetical protein
MLLLQLGEFDSRSVVCGCEFSESIPGAAEGGYGSGPKLLLIAPNADPPYALVNLGRGNLKLSPVKPVKVPMFHCEVGERFLSDWRSDTVHVRARLDVVGSGEEACWFNGTVQTTVESSNSEVSVKGACGC